MIKFISVSLNNLTLILIFFLSHNNLIVNEPCCFGWGNSPSKCSDDGVTPHFKKWMSVWGSTNRNVTSFPDSLIFLIVFSWVSASTFSPFTCDVIKVGCYVMKSQFFKLFNIKLIFRSMFITTYVKQIFCDVIGFKVFYLIFLG